MTLSRALFAAVVASAGVLGQDDCTATGSLVNGASETFAFCTGVLDMNIFWNYNPPNVEVLVQASNDGWHAFGFSSGSGGNSMAPSNVVMGCFSGTAGADADPNLADWNIAGRVTPTQGTNQALLNFSQINDGNCAFRFTRPLAPVGIAAQQQLGNQDTRTIAARGGDALAQHSAGNRVAFDVNFATGVNNDASSLRAAPVSLAFAAVGVLLSLM